MKKENDKVWEKIGLNIMKYRKSKKLTQEQLAEMCNISRNYYQRIESAASSCSIDTLMTVAEKLEIPLKDLFEF